MLFLYFIHLKLMFQYIFASSLSFLWNDANNFYSCLWNTRQLSCLSSFSALRRLLSACLSLCASAQATCSWDKDGLMKRWTGRRRTGSVGWGGSKMKELSWLIFNRLLDLTLLKDPHFTWLQSYKRARPSHTHTHHHAGVGMLNWL